MQGIYCFSSKIGIRKKTNPLLFTWFMRYACTLHSEIFSMWFCWHILNHHASHTFKIFRKIRIFRTCLHGNLASALASHRRHKRGDTLHLHLNLQQPNQHNLRVHRFILLRVCLVPPCKRKKAVNALKWKGILLIWSTKWSLFIKLFAWMGCKSRDESNEPT